MARKQLSPDDESRLIEDAEAARDGSSKLLPSPLRKAPGGSVVLSVRLPMERAMALRQLAAERGESMSELMDAAVDALLVARGPVVYMSKNLSRVALAGLGTRVDWGRDTDWATELKVYSSYSEGKGLTTLSPSPSGGARGSETGPLPRGS